MVKIGLKLFALTALLSTLSCSPEHDGDFNSPSLNGVTLNPNPDPLLAAAAASILGSRCVSCHGSSGINQKFLKTTNDPGLAELALNTRYVKPGQSDISFLAQRSSDLSMPPGSPLNSGEAQTIKDWIDDLATVTEIGPPSVTFLEVETLILAPKCYTCHSGGSSGPTFSDYASVRSTIVTPGTLDSALYQSTARPNLPMPKNGTALNVNELAMIESWIMGGALNN